MGARRPAREGGALRDQWREVEVRRPAGEGAEPWDELFRAQVPATEELVTDEPVTTESMTRSRSKTTEKPL
jgi:hypothetical protein